MANPRHPWNAGLPVGKPWQALGSRVCSTMEWKTKGTQCSSGDKKHGHPQKTLNAEERWGNMQAAQRRELARKEL